jgi:hypothetical protein
MIKGTLDPDAVDERHRVSLPATYDAKLTKTTKTRYSTGKEEVRWHLVSLDLPSTTAKQDSIQPR